MIKIRNNKIFSRIVAVFFALLIAVVAVLSFVSPFERGENSVLSVSAAEQNEVEETPIEEPPLSAYTGFGEFNGNYGTEMVYYIPLFRFAYDDSNNLIHFGEQAHHFVVMNFQMAVVLRELDGSLVLAPYFYFVVDIYYSSTVSPNYDVVTAFYECEWSDLSSMTTVSYVHIRDCSVVGGGQFSDLPLVLDFYFVSSSSDFASLSGKPFTEFPSYDFTITSGQGYQPYSTEYELYATEDMQNATDGESYIFSVLYSASVYSEDDFCFGYSTSVGSTEDMFYLYNVFSSQWEEINVFNRLLKGHHSVFFPGEANPDYETGFQDGYNKGYEDGQLSIDPDIIYENGYRDGYEKGKADGYDEGYAKGVEDSKHYTFFGLLSAVVDAPVHVFSSLLDVDILGFNLGGLFRSLLLVALVVASIRLFSGIGGKG